MPGAYVEVLLPLRATEAMTIPTNALMIRGEGVRVAIVDGQNRIHLRPIKVGRNYGESVEVLDGVSANDRLVLNPSDSLAEGDQVAVAPATRDVPNRAAKGVR
jgi:multidrug efflux pump subunit AcrA (membrane-fusion protein)